MEDSDEDIVVISCILSEEEEKKKRKRKIWVHNINSKRFIFGEFHTLYSDLLQDENRFFGYIHMTRKKFFELHYVLHPHITKLDTNFRKPIGTKERLLLCLRYLATGNGFRTLAYNYRLGERTVRAIVQSTCLVIWNVLQPIVMPIPDENIWIASERVFSERWNFPNAVGSLDGKHILIEAPPHSGSNYYCYKKHFSTVLLALVDGNYKFIAIDVSAYGKNSDSTIFRNSNLGRSLESNSLNMPPRKIPPGGNVALPHVIVGDEAFPLSTNIMRPYSRDQAREDEEKKIFYLRLSRARNTVEDTFGQLVKKFRLFERRLCMSHEHTVCIVKAVCCLHNFLKEDECQWSASDNVSLRDMDSIRDLNRFGGNSRTAAVQISGKLHPGCDTCTDKDTLVYIKAEGAKDTIHQIWDFTRNAPTIILTVGGVNSTMDILWEGAYPVKFTMNEKPKYSFATAFDKLYEYDDILDNGYIDWRSPRREVPLNRATWTLRDQVMTEDEVMVHVQGRLWEEKTSLIDVKFDLLPYADYAADLPHLIHTANSTLIDLSLVNLTTSRDYNASRFAARLLMVSVDARNDTMRYTMRKSLDDEHTPGVFEIVEIKSPGSAAGGAGGFLQFRPVAYTQECRGVASSTYVHVSPFNRTRIPERSSVRTFYSDFEWSSLLVQDVLVSFGEPGDGYYAHHNYTSWSLTVGYGAPPLEGFSPFVIAIIACGLGLPILLALSGALYALLRRRRRNTPTRFVDDQ